MFSREALGKVVLIGMMGVGKTTVGRLLSKKLLVSFYDTDQEIETTCGVRIPLIFDIEGEEGFRKRETSTLEGLLQRRESMVLATGGGVVLAERNRTLLASTTVFYMEISQEEIAKRMRSMTNRPLLAGDGDPVAKWHEIFEARKELYQFCADYTLDVSGTTPVKLASEMLEILMR